jgi:hypothetical protein
MADFKHTPGPWRVYEQDDLVVCFGDGDSICDAAPGSPFVKFGVAKANARLIAAAPDLLSACASVWLMLSDTGDNELRLIADECRAALTKATHPESQP